MPRLLAIIAFGIVRVDRSDARNAFTARAVLLTQSGDRAAALPFAIAGLGGDREAAEAAIDTLGGRLPLVSLISVEPLGSTEMAPDGSAIVTRSQNYELAIWDPETGARRGPVHNATDFWLADAGQRVVVLSEDYGVEISNGKSGSKLRRGIRVGW